MTMADGDWGVDQWDVDTTAESLNKALFGKRRKKSGTVVIKPDLDVHGKTRTDVGQDVCDEDDGDEKLSKKAKKKLKEKRRKENLKDKKRNKQKGSNENAEDETLGEEAGNVKNKLAKSSSKVLANKKKKEQSKEGKPDIQTENKKLLKDRKSILLGKELKNEAQKIRKVAKDGKHNFLDKDDQNEDIISKKRKKSLSTDDSVDIGEISTTSKQQKMEKDDNVMSETPKEGEMKRNRKRKKKNKPSSKKNKYKHLGLKSDRPVMSDSDSSDGSDGGRKTYSNKQETTLVSVSDETPVKGKNKRKRSPSPERSLVKKGKFSQESEKPSAAMSKKQKKSSDVSSNNIEEKPDDVDAKQDKKSKKLKKKSKEGGIIDSQYTIDHKTKSVTKAKITDGVETKHKKLKNVNKLKTSQETQNNNDISPGGSIKEKEKDNSKTGSTIATISPFFSSHGMEQQQKCLEKLVSGRFRFINEQLYSIKGGEAFRMFQQDKTLMDVYNSGFQSQARLWSVNPLDVIIKQLSSKPSNLKVADFGCGEARLSASVPQKVHSFDLYALNKRVTVCNMSKTPLDIESVDIVVFCLSLMGTNLNDYLLEANRVLKEGGILKVAEVVSRFTDVGHFVSGVSSMGFKCVNSRDLSKMFYLMDFKKVKSVKKTSKQIKALSLNPCVYKKR